MFNPVLCLLRCMSWIPCRHCNGVLCFKVPKSAQKPQKCFPCDAQGRWLCRAAEARVKSKSVGLFSIVVLVFKTMMLSNMLVEYLRFSTLMGWVDEELSVTVFDLPCGRRFPGFGCALFDHETGATMVAS